MIEDRNEAKLLQDIARLIILLAEVLAIRDRGPLTHLIKSVNEG